MCLSEEKEMELTIIKDLYRDTDKYIGKEIEVGGWIRSIRDSKTFGFIVLNDGTFFETLQIVYHDEMENFANTLQAVFRVRSLIAYAIHQFFQERDFVYVHTPLITGSDCEGAGEMFRVTTLDMNDLPKTDDGKVDYTKDFFGKETNLTVSGQLNGETYAMAFRNIYTFGPTFRAENSNTTRHAAEFWMIEPEMAFADLKDDMMLAEAMLKYVIKYVMDNAPEEMKFFNNFVDKCLIRILDT